MLDDLNLEDLPDEMHKYVKSHTYIEAKDMELFRKKLLFTMPRVPLKKCRNVQATSLNVPPLFHRLYKYNERRSNIPVK